MAKNKSEELRKIDDIKSMITRRSKLEINPIKLVCDPNSTELVCNQLNL